MDTAISPLDWRVIAQIAAPLIALFVGAWLNRYLERRPKLVSYFGHVSSFTITQANAANFVIHHHAIVLRNNGGLPAKNVRVSHLVLPDFNVWPTANYTVAKTTGGLTDIVFPAVVPGEEITISYMYTPPRTVGDVNHGIRYDDGFAIQIPVLLQRVYPKWFNALAAGFFALGVLSAVYLLWLGIRFVYLEVSG
jgi:hypothetical protein